MASSTAEPSGELPEVAVTVGPAELTRTVEWVERGAIVTFELGSDGAAPTRVRLEQPLPADLPVSDAGFRQDAEPAEWSVEDGVVSGTADAPVDDPAAFVLGMKFSEPAPASASFPEPTLSEAEGASVAVDDSRVVGDDDSGALAETVRQVIGGADDGDAAADGGRWQEAGGGGTTTDADEPTPRDLPADPDADDLEAAVAAVEAELDDGAGDEVDDDGAENGAPELDLSVPGEDDGPTDDALDDGDGATDADETVAGGVDVPAPDEMDATTGDAERSPVDIAEGLADADEALDLEMSGTVAVRLRDLESRLSAFEAYEDALAAFIEDTGTAAEVREAAAAAESAATDAAESVEALREDVAAVETELAAVREEAEAAHAAAEAAREEREALREDLDDLRADVDEAAGLRTQLLDALSDADAGTASAD